LDRMNRMHRIRGEGIDRGWRGWGGKEIRIRIRITIRIRSGIIGGPEFVEEVGVAVGGTDDAEFAGAGFEWVGEDGENGAPDLFGLIMKRKFGEDEVGAVAADGLGFGGERGDAAAVVETDLGF